jgi:large subunit ribosomal protein L21
MKISEKFMYAVVSSGGKQYRVEPGSTLIVERLAADPGASITFDRVLLVGDGDQVRVGTPVVAGASVRATVLGEERGPKLVVFKFKQKVKYRRRTGHRQRLMKVRIDAIDADGAAPKQRAARQSAKADAGAPATAAEAAPEKTPPVKAPPAKRGASRAKAAPAKAAAAKPATEKKAPEKKVAATRTARSRTTSARGAKGKAGEAKAGEAKAGEAGADDAATPKPAPRKRSTRPAEPKE